VDADELSLLEGTLRKAMTAADPGAPLYAALCDLGWRDMLAEQPGVAVPLVFRLLGATGAHAPVLTDVVAPGNPGVRLPYAGGGAVAWIRSGDKETGTTVDAALPLITSASADPLSAVALAAGRRALGWWLLGTGRAMLALARAHAVDRVQFGKPIASFQAVRHKLAETLVALEGAAAVLSAAGPDELSSLLAKAAAGHAALLAARHCQQVLGGIGFTAEHPLHTHMKRALVLDGLLGSARELTRAAGRAVIDSGSAPRLVDL
jgi:acyl-CoA dehydrogenase-like protein